MEAAAVKALDNTRSMGVALSPCTVPMAGTPTFTIGEDEMEIGMGQHGLEIAVAMQNYVLLTIGDGLVSQTPALLISLAAGLLVTRSSRPVDLPSQFLSQLFSDASTTSSQ